MRQRKGSVFFPLLATAKAGSSLLVRLVIYAGWSLVLGVIMLPYLVFKLFVPESKNSGQPISRWLD